MLRLLRPAIHVSHEPDSLKETYACASVSPLNTKLIEALFTVAYAVAAREENEQQVEEQSIICTGMFLRQAGDVISRADDACRVISDRFANELTQQTAISVFTRVMCEPFSLGAVRSVAISSAASTAILLRKASRPLRLVVLAFIEQVFDRYGVAAIDVSSLVAITGELGRLIQDTDLQFLQLALSLLVDIMDGQPRREARLGRDIRQRSSSHLRDNSFATDPRKRAR